MSCQSCNPNLEALKTAQWDRYDSERRAADLVDQRDLVMLWAKAEVSVVHRYFRIPELEEMKRRFPQTPQSRKPREPQCEDVRR